MKSFNLEQCCHWLGNSVKNNPTDIKEKTKENAKEIMITGISIDTRTLKPGDLYVAIIGENLDGHQFVLEAEKKGASAVLISNPSLPAISSLSIPIIEVPDTLLALGQLALHYRRQFNCLIGALTGSCGKTSVKEMIAKIIAVKGPSLSNKGNLNTEIGVPLTLFNLEETHQRAIVEMGARKKGDIRYLMGIAEPMVTLITNAGVAHMEIFGSQFGIAEAKGEIYSELNIQGTAVINLDEQYANYWKGLLKSQKIITYGFNPEADVTVDIIEENILGSRLQLKTFLGDIEINLSTPGKHSISNAMAAASVALGLGVDLSDVKAGLEAFVPVSGRLQSKMTQKGVRIIDDTYNANPYSVKAAIDVLANFPGSTIFVMADMLELGPDTEKLHYEMGSYAKLKGIKHLLGLGPLTQHAVRGFGENAQHYTDKKSLMHDLLKMNDLLNLRESAKTSMGEDTAPLGTATVLVKGSRGMKMEEVVSTLLSQLKEVNVC